ncbi:unnamed protein product [Camellia sinensis]
MPKSIKDDILTWTLIVKEAVYYSAQLQLPNSMPKVEKKERVENTTIREMGFQDSMNTRIGGWGNKGQKRKVSICIEILTRPKLLFLDEPTSGLDITASCYVMSRIVKLAKQDRMTVIAFIHQPSSEVFGLFHNLCLLSLGQTIYFGSPCAANQVFAMNGFPCPMLQNPADHYLRKINTDFDEDIEQGDDAGKMTTEEVIDVLAESYKSSDICKQIYRQVAEICRRDGGVIEKKGSQANFFTQCLVLTERSLINMYRDPGYYWWRLAIYMALGSGLGNVFYDVGPSYGSIHAREEMKNSLLNTSPLCNVKIAESDSKSIETTLDFNSIDLEGNFEANCSGIAEIPFAGSVFSPRERHLKMKSNSLDVVSRSRSKKIPPKNGLKNRSTIESEKPILLSKSRVETSSEERISPSDLIKTRILVNATRNLSTIVPMGLVRP